MNNNKSSLRVKSLDQFVIEVKKAIETFEADWKDNHRKEPDKYPLEIPIDNAGLWYEFFNDHLLSDDVLMDLEIKNCDVLDQLKVAFGYKTDSEVAGFLGVNKDTVSQIRVGKLGFGINQKFKIMDKLKSIQINDLVEQIDPENLYREINRLSLGGAEGLALNDKEIGEKKEIDAKLIDYFKSYGNELNLFNRDWEMADFIGLKRATISGVRTGKSKLGPLPRLSMLKAIHPEINIEQVISGIESNNYFMELIKTHITMADL